MDGDQAREGVVQRFEVGPFLLRAAPAFSVAAGVALAVLLYDRQIFFKTVQLVLAYIVTPAGQEAWLAIGHEAWDLSHEYVGMILWSVSLSQCLFFSMAVHVEGLAQRLPRIGARITAFEKRVRRSRAAERSVAFGLAVVVALPIHTGGAMLGSMAGRALGLRWHAVVAAVMSAVTVRFALAYATVKGLVSAGVLTP